MYSTQSSFILFAKQKNFCSGVITYWISLLKFTYNAVPVSGVQQSVSDIHIPIFIIFQCLFYFSFFLLFPQVLLKRLT